MSNKITLKLSTAETNTLYRHLSCLIGKGSISTTPSWAKKIMSKIEIAKKVLMTKLKKGEKMKKKLKTITICVQGDLRVVLCPGHVKQKDFNDAFKNEGWSYRGNYEQKDLKYVYVVLTKTTWKVKYPGFPKAKPFTLTPWG